MRNLTVAELGRVSGGQGGTSISVAQQNYSATDGPITQANFATFYIANNSLGIREVVRLTTATTAGEATFTG